MLYAVVRHLIVALASRARRYYYQLLKLNIMYSLFPCRRRRQEETVILSYVLKLQQLQRCWAHAWYAV